MFVLIDDNTKEHKSSLAQTKFEETMLVD